MMNWIPDLLTASRLLLAALIVALGVARGRDAVAMALILAMVAWISDNLDGFMARRIPNRQPSWLGRHEFAVDVVFTWATLA
ncbi:MAG: CDP-alcohol phosphatidyltransferase family protein, partial [Anaerolineae bacterium]